jgi:cytochrome c peroxidase
VRGPLLRLTRKRIARSTHQASGEEIPAHGCSLCRSAEADLPAASDGVSLILAKERLTVGKTRRAHRPGRNKEIVMRPADVVRKGVGVSACLAILAAAAAAPANGNARNMFVFADPSGSVRTFNTDGAIDRDSLFFQSLGTNGRSCGSCHEAADGWTIVPAHVQARFQATGGTDPIFRTNDGSNSPYAEVSTVAARRRAYSMLLTKGLIRVGIGMPADTDFDLVAVDDPYGYASAAELSLFRRPLPSTNLAFLSAVMWDGRETFAGRSVHFDLSDQANGATLGHAAATHGLTDRERNEIVAFETSLYTAQSADHAAGMLNAERGNGGPVALSREPFSIGINDALSPGFNPRAFTLFDGWKRRRADADPMAAARAAIYRGQEIFNTRSFTVAAVRGLNDALGQPAITATCTVCHDSPNVGDHSVPLPLDLGLTDEAVRTPDMPLYTFRSRATGETVRTTDPGRALITGRWKDMSKFKGPVLRALAARAPYFHNGFAATLEDAVNFYDRRFDIRFSAQEKSDLVAFLRAL